MPLLNPPKLLGVTTSSIPSFLTSRPRWAMWEAVWSEPRQKYDKRPKHPQGYGISTLHTAKWCSYETALAALPNPAFAGIGYLMTAGDDGLVGIDMDKCVQDGVIAPWAQEIVTQVGSYTEISPSGNGIRIFTTGSIEFDWTNHQVGIEVYAGHTARFLTVTGQHLAGTPRTVNVAPLGLLVALATTHAKTRESATVISMSMPEIICDLALPSADELELPYKVKDYLADGTQPANDRSLSLLVTSIALHKAGLSTDQVFSILANNQYTMEAALEKRGQDMERALLYLWVHHAQKAAEKVTSGAIATLADFEDVSEKRVPTVADDFEVVSVSGNTPNITPNITPLRFNIQQAGAFMQSSPTVWHIKGVLPQAEVAAVIGASGSGKTFFVLDMLMAVATGSMWRGRRVKQCPVLYICAEGAGGFRNRLKAYAKANDLNLDELPFYVLGDAPNMMEKGDVKDLVASIRALPEEVGIICADTWAQVTAGGNENSGEDMGRALANCKALHRVTKASVLLVAHTGKMAERGMRGWSGVKGALDAEMTVERSGEYRSATLTKMKDGSEEGTAFNFSLDTVSLGVDSDGDEITSCIVRVKDTTAAADKLPAITGKFQIALMNVIRSAADFEVTAEQVISLALAQTPNPKRCDKGNLERALQSLLTNKRVFVENGLIANASSFSSIVLL